MDLNYHTQVEKEVIIMASTRDEAINISEFQIITDKLFTGTARG